ncbi:MAG: radical SAM protein [Ignavibacteria bacterium]|nr:radical SAM protein [Ignavibacteria bacterium]
MLKLNHLDYYRLPWNLSDNIISWLEPTAKCNLACLGCYRKNEVNSHKTLAEIKEELKVFMCNRNTDSVSIAGGEPLLHPQIAEIVKMVADSGCKPIVNTNGIALTPELLHKLKLAGVFGFTFHIDSGQNRPGWKNADEMKLNELRYKFAKMLADEGGISCSFNSTVYEDTLKYIPDMLRWAQQNIDIVNVMVFILYRAVNNNLVDFYLGPKIIDMTSLVYNEDVPDRTDLKAEEAVEMIRTQYPDFDPCAYLNGSEKADSFKWLLSGRIGTKKHIYGYMGNKAMEFVQTGYHFLYNKYLSYTHPKMNRKGKSMITFIGLFDRKLRKTFFRFFRNPLRIFTKLYYQSVMIIQPVDFLEDGSQSMCDGCPDMTVWNGKLVYSCRMEEQLKYGYNLRTFSKDLNKKIKQLETV